VKQWVTTKKQTIIEKYSSVIREKAIEQAKVEIALAGKRITDYDEDQIEVIVKDQEDKIVKKYKNSSLVVLLLIFGIY
jgi:hypothetical protein